MNQFARPHIHAENAYRSVEFQHVNECVANSVRARKDWKPGWKSINVACRAVRNDALNIESLMDGSVDLAPERSVRFRRVEVLHCDNRRFSGFRDILVIVHPDFSDFRRRKRRRRFGANFRGERATYHRRIASADGNHMPLCEPAEIAAALSDFYRVANGRRVCRLQDIVHFRRHAAPSSQSQINSFVRSGCSSGTRWPAPRTTSSFAPGIKPTISS